jgi:lipopolysaccharide transport system ATP-binding protein
MNECIRVEHISKRYELGKLNGPTMLREQIALLGRRLCGHRAADLPSIWALKDVSFSIGQGEVVGIIGRNGSGKSTILKVLSKITHPTSGAVQVKGRVASLLEVGTGFHEELTGRENIFLNGSILGMPKKQIAARLDEIIDFAAVDRFVDTPIKRYSSGMRLRLGFAVAAHLDPDILIIDEVLAVGDAGFQKKCLNVMRQLRGAGRTVLFVSHNMAAVENLCGRAILLNAGEVQADGDVKSLIQQYLSSFAGSGDAMSDLGGMDGRSGSGEVRFTAIEFRSPAGEPQPITRSGEPLTIRLHYRATETVPNPSFGFRLYTEMGTLVTETSTWHHGIEIPKLTAGEGYLDLDIEALTLLAGRYQLSLWITGIPPLVYDGLEQSIHLDIETANIYRSGRQIDNRLGIVYFPQRWRLDGLLDPALESDGLIESAR